MADPADPADPAGLVASLSRSAARLRGLVEPLDDDAITQPAYPTEWSIAQVLSHLGSGAVLARRRIEAALAGSDLDADVAPAVWAVWDAKGPRGMVDDALVEDAATVELFEGLTPAQTADLHLSMGPIELDAAGFVAMRLNEHVLHTWDVEVVLDPAATLPPAEAALVVDNLALVARFAAKPTDGPPVTVVVATTAPARSFAIGLTDSGVTMAPAADGAPVDLELPAEAFVRLVYGRLDPDHTPAVTGDPALLDRLRATYPGG